MAAKGNYIIIEESILRDPLIEDLVLQGGYEAFGYYIAILSVMRDYRSYGYRIPISRLDILASSRLLIYREEERKRFGEMVGLMVVIGLLKQEEGFIWSERRTRDLVKQDDSRRKMSEAGIKGMANRYGGSTF